MVISGSLRTYVDQLDTETIPGNRHVVLDKLIQYIQQQRDNKNPINLNFICTHNSRRSQFSQVWGQFMAIYHNINHVRSASGGVEVTACNPRTVASLRRAGFDIPETDGENPEYSVYVGADQPMLKLYSKRFDEEFDAEDKFAAIMTCSHADENCPFIPNAEIRIPLNYEDPKEFDDTDKENEMYDERCRQIATELMYVFRNIK